MRVANANGLGYMEVSWQISYVPQVAKLSDTHSILIFGTYTFHIWVSSETNVTLYMCQADQADAALEVLACYVKHDYKELTARQEFVLTYLLTWELRPCAGL